MLGQNLSSESDAQLWQQLRTHSHAALAAMYGRYGADLIRYGNRLTDDEHLVQDCVQDLFVELWNRRLFIAPDVQNLRLYLLGALRHKVTKAIRAQQRHEGWSDASEGAFSYFSPEDVLIQSQHEEGQRERLQQAMTRLAPRQQEVIHLRFFHNLSHAEMATVMNMQAQSVRNLLHGALHRLRELVLPYVQLTLLLVAEWVS
ncbi:sigma-70 family RNA polymerase sigma factor [Rudanella paleaurantiibacter]|uniref:Sigma-70 family RNA polymerase sigma factor n=1 Tax=Rudanella paleaurantiibacter TaxID=2614655 RepID=A0A7J5TZQ5_9BACT|nr:sigma-70 family RNA polymerase sigma factor [Rudanella paleaurantiibacter]KAB7730863.1 sigma-70 family RNA polymerase sigma factor [Rudanella paleaurantiibacter]